MYLREVSIRTREGWRGYIAFDTAPESWMAQQTQYDLWKAWQNRSELNVKRLKAA